MYTEMYAKYNSRFLRNEQKKFSKHKNYLKKNITNWTKLKPDSRYLITKS